MISNKDFFDLSMSVCDEKFFVTTTTPMNVILLYMIYQCCHENVQANLFMLCSANLSQTHPSNSLYDNGGCPSPCYKTRDLFFTVNLTQAIPQDD